MKLDDFMTESVWQSEVVALAKGYGWFVFHALPAQNSRGKWATHQIGDSGFPDLVLVHPDKGCVFAELKTNKGHLTEKQREWLDYLHSAGQETHVWRPRDRAVVRLRLMGDRHA